MPGESLLTISGTYGHQKLGSSEKIVNYFYTDFSRSAVSNV